MTTLPFSFTLTNPGAELGNTTGWTTVSTGNMGVTSSPGGGSPHTGTWAFTGSASDAKSWSGQTLSIPSDLNTLVDNGQLTITAAAWHNGNSGDADSGALCVECLDVSGNWLAGRFPVQTDPTTWTNDTLAMRVAPGTRSIRISTRNWRVAGTELSTYWDDFTLTLSNAADGGYLKFHLDAASTTGWTQVTGTLSTTNDGGGFAYDTTFVWSGSATGEAYKTITITDATEEGYIDAGQLTALMYYRQSNFDTGGDAGRTYLEFYNVSNVIIGSRHYSDAADYNAAVLGEDKSWTVAVPANTRSVRLGIVGTRLNGSNLDAYFTRMSLFFTGTPVGVSGTMTPTGPTDTFAATGGIFPRGTWGSTEAKDIFTTPPFGTMGATEAKDSFGFTGHPQLVGTWGSTEAADAYHMAGGAIPDLTLDSFASGIAVTPPSGIAPTQVQATISTTFLDDVIVVMVASGGFWDYHPVASVSDTAGLTWHRRASRPAAYSVTGAKNVEIWWAHAPTPLSADVITVTTTGTTGQLGVNVVAIAGANFNTPWDVHPYANQWNFRDAFFEPIETGFVSTHAAKTMTLLMGAGANAQSSATTNFPYTFLGTVGGEEHNGGNPLNVGSAYNINSTPQDQQLVKFGPNGHAYFYSDSIVQAGQTGTAQEILYYLDGFFWQIGTGVQIWPNNVNNFTGANGTVQCNISTSSPNEVILAVVSLYNVGGAGQVSSIADSAGLASGWTRRSRKTTVDGTMALEVWYAIAPTTVGGMAITAHTSGTVANDYAQILAFGVVGATYFYDGILWDGDASLPDVATYTSATTALGQVVTGMSTINMNTLDLAFMTNIDVSQPFNPAPGGAAAYPDALGPYANTNAPNDSIGVLFKFSGIPLTADLMSSSVSTKKWVTVGDALPVGPPQPPIGVWGSHEGVDIWSAAGFVPAFGTMNPTEHTDTTGGAPNIAPFTGVGWLGWVPAFATWGSTDSKDRAVAEGWVIGVPLTGVMGPTESKDRAALSNRATVTGTMGLTELNDRIASSGFEIPKALPKPARKRRLLIVS